MPSDMGTLAINTAGTAETLASDLDTDATVISDSRVTGIAVKARAGNAGNVYFGRSTVSSTYGMELLPGDSYSRDYDGTVTFGDFYGDATDTGDMMDWDVEFEQ